MSNSIAILFALDLGANIFQVNLINTMQSTMSILLLVPFGILSDRYGRKPMILYPRAIIIVGTVMRAFATNPNHLIIASLVGGFAGGSYFPVLLSMIADISKEEERQECISTLFLFSSIGMVLGPLLAAFLLLLPQITLRSIYQITAIAQLFVLLYLAIVIRETKPPLERQEKKEALTYIKQLISQTSFQDLLIVAFLYNFYHSIFRTYAPIYGRLNLNLTNAEIVSLDTYRNLGIMLIRLSSATFLTRVPITPFLVLVLCLGGLTGFLILFATNYTLMVLILFLVGVSFGAFRILSTTLVAKNSVPENRGIANSLLDLSQSTGNLTKILTSSMAEHLGLVPVFILGGATCLSTIIPTLWRKLGR
jgi:MFS family permease